MPMKWFHRFVKGGGKRERGSVQGGGGEWDFSMLQGAKAVKEELLDDIIKESGPYKPPGKLLTRREGCNRTGFLMHVR